MAAEQVLRSFASFEGRSKLSTWSYRICYLTVLRHERWYRRWLRRFTLAERGEIESHAPRSTSRPSKSSSVPPGSAKPSHGSPPSDERWWFFMISRDTRSKRSPASSRRSRSRCRSRLRDGRRDLARILGADPYFGDEACRSEETER